MQTTDFPLRGDHITLDALLKASGIVSSGGAAKVLIAEGGVRVNGEVEMRRGRKLRSGDDVVVGGQRLLVRAARDPARCPPILEGTSLVLPNAINLK